MNKNICFKLSLCTLLATVASLTTHMYVMRWLQPYINLILEMCANQGINVNPDASTYTWVVIIAAYVTAFIMVGAYALLYYYLQDRIPGTSRLTKWFWLTLIIFAVKGDLIRQPIMNFILSYQSMPLVTALKFVALNHLDTWLANIFLAFCLVYVCPKKIDQ